MQRIILPGRPRVPDQIELIKVPNLLITPDAYEKLIHFIDLYPEEISGAGRVRLEELIITKYSGTPLMWGKEERVDAYTRFIIYDIFTVKTFNLPAHTDAKEGFKDLWTELIERGEDTSDIRVWWHSHVNMGAGWSGEDDNTAFNFDCDFMISIVGNKKQEFRVRLDIYTPIRISMSDVFRPLRISIDNIPFPRFHIPEESPLREEVKKQIKKYAMKDKITARTASKAKKKVRPK